MFTTSMWHGRYMYISPQYKKNTYMQMFMAPKEDTALHDNIHVCTFNPDKTNST